MKFVPLGPDPKIERLATIISVAAVLVLTAVIVPLARVQLGDKGWQLLQETAGASFWPLAASAALGACLLLAYALGLHRRPRLGLLLVLLPAVLATVGAAQGIFGAHLAEASPARGGDVVLARLAASLAAPTWALLLASGLAAAGGVVLGARELARARSLALPWMPLLAALATITVVNTWSSYAKLPPRPLISLLVAAALLGPLLAVAAYGQGDQEDQADPPEAEPHGGATLILCILLSVGATLAAVGAEALIFRAAALYAQGPGAEAHHHAMVLGGARGTTIRMVSGAVAVLGMLATVTVALWPIRDQLHPVRRRATPVVVIALILLAVTILGAAVQRRSLSSAITRANRRPAATDTDHRPAATDTDHHTPPMAPRPRPSAQP